MRALVLVVLTAASACAAGSSGGGGDGGAQATSSSTTGSGGGQGGQEAGTGGAGGMGGGLGGMGGMGGMAASVCGDGVVGAGEECDDGNADPSDRCDACKVHCLQGELQWLGNKHCYADFNTQKINFASALQACASKGGYLASVTSQAEQDFVFGVLIDKSVLLPRWLGLTDLATEGTFVWSSGEPFSYTHWGAQQPDNYNDAEDCVEMYHVTGEWNDDNCTYEYEYVCEYTPAGLKP
jgi:cysteine-rich repeat protein